MNIDGRKKKLIERLKDKVYRDSFVVSHITNGVASQIKTIRENRVWTQKELGEQADMKQERISVLEDPNNSNVSIKTLRRIASALDVALMVKFVPFSDLVRWDINLSQDTLNVVSFGEDAFFKEETKAELSSSFIDEMYRPKKAPVTDMNEFKRDRAEKSSALNALSANNIQGSSAALLQQRRSHQ
jgi:transcriptional regulator with XRE-family HTH domain